MAAPGNTAIGSVGALNVFLPEEERASTAVLSVDSMQPADVDFVGRAGQLSELTAFFGEGNGPNTIVVSGPPGVGKSALVHEAARRSLAEGVVSLALFADLHGYDELPSDRVQAAGLLPPMLQGLGVPGEQIPETEGRQATLYHQLLNERAAAGEKTLIWFDNVGDRGQVQGLIPSNPVHRIAVTTRNTFPSSAVHKSIELDVMPLEEALELLAQAIGPDGKERIAADPKASQHVATLCDHLPLALRIVAALLADEPHRTTNDLAVELEEEAHRLDGLHYDERLSVRAAFNLSYNRLSDGLQRLFRLLSQIPGGDIGLDAARWLLDASAVAIRPQLMSLVRSHLVRQHVANRWSMHDLIRIYAAEMAATDPEDADRALRIVVERYAAGVVMAFEWLTAVASDATRKSFETPAHAAAWFEAERTTLLSVLSHIFDREGYEDLSLAFGVCLADLLRAQAHWRSDFLEVAAMTASVVSRAQPQMACGSALSNLGTAFGMEGKVDEAMATFGRAVEMYESVDEVDRASGVRTNIGNLLQARGRYDEAIKLYREDLKQCPPSTHPAPAANTLSNLGGVLAKAGRPGEAVTQLMKAVSLCRRLDDRSGLATALLNLGSSYIELSSVYRDPMYVRKAVTALEEAHRISRSLRDKRGQANSANNLGVALCSLYMFDEGTKFLREAIQYFEASGQDEQASRTRWHLEQAERAMARGQRPTMRPVIRPR